MSWTTPTDVTDPWIGDDVPTDTEKVQIWIDKAEREMRRKVEDLQKRIDDEADAEPDVEKRELLKSAVDVAVAMVTRVFRNPSGERSRSDSLGTGPLTETTSVTYGGDMPGQLALTPAELESLQSVQRGGAFEINLIPSDYQGMRYSPW